MGSTGSFGTYATSSTYSAGKLNKTVIVDEHGKQVEEFKDKGGKVILKKVQLAAADNNTGSIVPGGFALTISMMIMDCFDV